MQFTETHEWIAINQGIGTVGISAYAEKELGEIVYIELPTLGKEIRSGEEAAVLESTKAATDVYSPASGTIIEINEKLKTDSSLINTSPETDGWLFKLKLSEPQELLELMDKNAYLAMIA